MPDSLCSFFWIHLSGKIYLNTFPCVDAGPEPWVLAISPLMSLIISVSLWRLPYFHFIFLSSKLLLAQLSQNSPEKSFPVPYLPSITLTTYGFSVSLYPRRIVPKMILPAWTHLSARPHSLYTIFEWCESDQVSETRYSGFISPKISPTFFGWSPVILGNLLIFHSSQH